MLSLKILRMNHQSVPNWIIFY